MSIRYHSTADMSREEWLEQRRHSVGGSDAAAIVGLSKWASPYSVWADKTGKVPPKEDTEAMRLGRDLEDYVARRWMEATGKRVRRRNAMIYNDAYPFAHADVDRLVDGEKAGLECKTTSALDLRLFDGVEFPEQYYAQCVHYMAVTGCDRWYLCVLVFGRGVFTYTLERDQAEIDALMDAERAFWRYVTEDTPPPVDGAEATTDAITTIFAEGVGLRGIAPPQKLHRPPQGETAPAVGIPPQPGVEQHPPAQLVQLPDQRRSQRRPGDPHRQRHIQGPSHVPQLGGEVLGALAAVDADPHHHVVHMAALRLHGQLRQNAADLPPVQHHVVGPLDAALPASQPFHSPGHGHGAEGREGQQGLRGTVRPPQDGQVQPLPGGGEEAAPQPPSAGGLAVRDDHGAVGGAAGGQLLAGVVGGFRALQNMDVLPGRAQGGGDASGKQEGDPCRQGAGLDQGTHGSGKNGDGLSGGVQVRYGDADGQKPQQDAQSRHYEFDDEEATGQGLAVPGSDQQPQDHAGGGIEHLGAGEDVYKDA